MANKTENIAELIDYSKKGIVSKEILSDDKIDVTLFCMSAGTKLSEHTTTKKAIVNVIEGEGIFNLKGKDIKMVPGIIIYMDKNVLHSLKAINNISFTLTLIN